MDVEAIDCIDAHSEILESVFLHFPGWGAEDCHVYMTEIFDVGDYLVSLEFGWDVSNVAAYYACYFEIGSGLEGFHSEVADVAVANYGGADFCHFFSL